MPTQTSVSSSRAPLPDRRGSVSRVRELLPEDISNSLEPLFESYLTHTVETFRNLIEPDRLRRFFLRRALHSLHQPASVAIAVEWEGRLRGLASWSGLAWDSEMLGFAAARLDFLLAGEESAARTKRRLVEETLHGARQRGIRHMVARVDANDLSTAWALEQSGFETIDGIQTFSLCLRGRPDSSLDLAGGIQTRMFEERDLEQILAIARSSYVFDRFHADPAVQSATADRINEEWLLSSCKGKAADGVVVATEGSTVLGYATCKIDQEIRDALGIGLGLIVMVATEKRARNKGVGMACTAAALRWFQERNAEIVQVGTQLRNIAAARLYENCGFRMAANTLTLRKIM